MNVHNDGTTAECAHGIAEDIPADCLDHILGQLPSKALQPFPLLCTANTFIGNGSSAELVFSQSRFHICQLSARGKLDKEKARLVSEPQALHLLWLFGLDDMDGCPLDLAPEPDDVRIR